MNARCPRFFSFIFTLEKYFVLLENNFVKLHLMFSTITGIKHATRKPIKLDVLLMVKKLLGDKNTKIVFAMRALYQVIS